MHLIAISDIFGKTKHFKQIIDEISPSYTSIETIDPYNGDEINFKNEEEAYCHFQEKMSIEKYSDILLEKIQDREDKALVLLGFSIGASAIWAISEKLSQYNKTKAICFYSSQIRNYLDINPNILIDLYFSKTEPSYNVNEIIKKLSTKNNVTCHKTEYSHGFMNRNSKNFNQLGYNKYSKLLSNIRLRF
ncbi:MAG: dienelactone hydrolase family protein [Desulfotalea sp.]